MPEPHPNADEVASMASTGAPIPLEKVKAWMGSDDIEILGALHYRITQDADPVRIEPPLTLDEYNAFFLRYMGLCLREHPEGDWADDRTSAGRLWIGWFKRFWRREGPREPRVEELKSWLANYYKNADPDLRYDVVAFLLEHLFEDPEIADYFSDWREDPTLAEGYEQAMVWAASFHDPMPPADSAAQDEGH